MAWTQQAVAAHRPTAEYDTRYVAPVFGRPRRIPSNRPSVQVPYFPVKNAGGRKSFKGGKGMNEELIEMLEQKRFQELSRFLRDLTGPDIAALTDELPEQYLPLVYRLLPKDLAADAFVAMEPDVQELLITALSDSELQEVLNLLFLDDTVDLIEEMPANVVKRILQNSTADKRRQINEILCYPDDSAGSIMTTEYVDLKKDMTVADAFAHIRSTGVNKETIYTCYVTDANRTLLGLVTVRRLLLAEASDKIEQIMETNIIFARTLDDREDVAKQFDKYDFLALPVVDQENRLVGIVTVDDAMDVIHEEAEEDFEKMAAISPSEDTYFKTTVFGHAKNRILWLLVLMLSATLTGTIITKYEAAFSAIPMLVAFIPMLMDTGGNCGAQASTMVIRGMAVDEIHLPDFFRVLWKELRIALLVGVSLAAVNFVRIYIMYRSISMGIVTGLSLIGTVAIAKMLGCILPMTAKKLKLDPAIMASPIISTIVDACAVLLYFNIAVHAFNL